MEKGHGFKPEFRRLETGLGTADANFPVDGEGRVYHVGVRHGEVANRVVTVGDPSRASLLASLFDGPPHFQLATNRGFTTHTGLYKGVPLTVVATGMGTAMLDFMLRETAAVVDGPMAVIRLGTCGSVRPHMPVGHLSVAADAVLCRRNENAWSGDPDEPPYVFTRKPVDGDPELVAAVYRRFHDKMAETQEEHKVHLGLNCTADTFYASQGRTSHMFDDRNGSLISDLVAAHPSVSTLEMETFQLYHLAACSKSKRIQVAAACIILANRCNNDFLDADEKHRLERLAGECVMDTLVLDVDLPGAMTEGVWNLEHVKIES